ncbi:MAG: hypothetical protein ACI8TX_003648 [Hyphomicrobiaceae bacterium]|jgi:hypothetical protein
MLDGWANPFVFQPAHDPYRLYSTGRNGIDDGGNRDDISSGSSPNPEFYPVPKSPSDYTLLFQLIILIPAIVLALVSKWLFRFAARRKKARQDLRL